MMHTIIHKRLAACLLALALSLSLTAPALAAPASAQRQTAAQSAAAAAKEYGGAVSVQYALWEEGEITLSGGTGVYSKTENRALTDDTLYGIGSISKVYTTAAVMKLAEQGKVALDAPVVRYLPSFKMADSRYRDITLRMLLNHSSGLMGSSFQNAMLFGDADPDATDSLLKRLSTQRLKAEPGAYSVYCNDGFTLAELVVEAVSGMDFMDYLRANLLHTAELDNTFAPGGDFDAGRLAKTYQGTDTRALPQDCLNLVGAGGLYATASDVAAFGGALTGTSLLRASSLEAMAAPEYARGIWPEDTLDAVAYGLGWDSVEWYPFHQNGITALVKGGDTQYYHAGLVVLPEYGMAAAVLSSGGVSTYNEMAASRLLIDALAEKGVTVEETAEPLPPAEPAPMPAELSAHAGYYGATSAQYRVDVAGDGTLTMAYLTMPSLPAQTFAYHGDGSFRAAAGTAMVRFVKEDNGQVYLHQKAMGALPGLGGLPVSNYAAVRLAENPISPQVQAAWDEIGGRSYLPVEEKYSSQLYLALAGAGAMETPEPVPGYLGAARIVDETAARYELQLPGIGGRDGQDLRAYEEDGVRWLESGGSLFLAEEDTPALYTGSGWSYATIQPEGHARWYRVDGGAGGRTMQVQLPQDAGFWVYGADGQVTASSVLWGDAGAALESGGLVVFAGAPGARFHLSFQ